MYTPNKILCFLTFNSEQKRALKSNGQNMQQEAIKPLLFLYFKGGRLGELVMDDKCQEFICEMR